jgi:hypothetical protein
MTRLNSQSKINNNTNTQSIVELSSIPESRTSIIKETLKEQTNDPYDKRMVVHLHIFVMVTILHILFTFMVE